MWKVVKEICWRSRFLKQAHRELRGRMVEVVSEMPTEENPDGSVAVLFGRRIKLEDWKEIPTHAVTRRRGKLVITEIRLSPASIILLRHALDEVIQRGIEKIED